MTPPNELGEAISQDEQIIYFSGKLENKQTTHNYVKLSLILAIFLFIIFEITFNLTFIDQFEEWYEFVFLLFPFLFFLIPIVLYISRDKNYKYFSITDKNIYVLEYQKYHNQYVPNVYKIALSGIRGYSYLPYNKDKDLGGLVLIEKNTERAPRYKPSKNIYSLPNITHFTSFQMLFESTLYEYGEIEEKWKELMANNGLKEPIEIQISQTRLDEIKSRIKRYIVYLIVPPIICFLPILLRFFQISLFSILGVLLEIIIYIILMIVSASIIGIYLWNIYYFNARAKPQHAILKLESNNIFVQLNSDKFIEKTDTTSIIYTSLRGVLSLLKSQNIWEDWYDSIVIKPTSTSNNNFFFGPIENFSLNFELTLYYLLLSKAREGRLYGKTKILDYKAEREEIIDFEEKVRFQNY
jgi:hypothetical protein